MDREHERSEQDETAIGGSGGDRSSEDTTLLAPDVERPAASSRAPQLRRGAVLGRYVVLHALGSGAMGAVYLSYDPRLERRVALKLLHGVPTSSQRHRFVREARAMAKIAHPHVVPVYDFGTHDGRLFLAMELVEGRDLRAVARERQLGWLEALRMMRQAGEGLSAAHAAGLVHRDFKPANVMVDATGQALVTDFGLVGEAGDESSRPTPSEPLCGDDVPTDATRLTETGMVLGTPAYMAPEQYRGELVDARSDQYAFCVALFELLYGVRPFEGVNALMLEEAKLREEIRAVGRGQGPRRLLGILRRGLAAEPDRRWPTMDVLLEALGGVTRRRRWIAGSALAVAMGGGAVAWGATAAAPSPCESVGDELGWTTATRTSVGAATVSMPAELRERSLADLDDYARRWAAVRKDLCHLQTSEGDPGPQLRRQAGCLAEQRVTMGVVTQAIATSGQLSPLLDPLDPMLLPPERCTDDERLPPELGQVSTATASPLWADAARVGVHRRLGDLGPRAVAEPTIPAAAGLPALAATVQLEHALMVHGDQRRVTALLRVVAAAMEADDHRTVARAWVAIVEVIAEIQLRATEGLHWIDVVEAAIVRAGNEPGLRVRHAVAAARMLTVVDRVAEARSQLSELHREATDQGWPAPLVTRLLEAKARYERP
ncbi:MAG: serine/threonine protein kinase [Deltaproteobacteria bacterium]|nr:serine/threonine protein kinase [Deltaproteobacteria bacterium]